MADRRLRRHLSQDEMNMGIGMLHSGLSQRHVANVLGVSQSVVSRMWNRFITTGNVRHLHAGGGGGGGENVQPMRFKTDFRFCVDFTDRRARVWRMPNERFAPVCVAEHDRFGGGSVMVWAGISAQGKTDLHVIDNGTLTALRYVNEILDVYVRPYAGGVCEISF